MIRLFVGALCVTLLVSCGKSNTEPEEVQTLVPAPPKIVTESKTVSNTPPPSVKLALNAARGRYEKLSETAEDPSSVVDTCVEANVSFGVVKQVCIGLIQKACPGMAGSTREMMECSSKEFDYWDGRLNRAYLETLAKLQVEDEEEDYSDIRLSDDLTSAQLKWIEYRDASCGLERNRFRGGTMGSLTSASCMIDLTADRALAIEQFLGEHFWE